MQSHDSFVQFCRADPGDSIKFPPGLIRPDIAGTSYETSIFLLTQIGSAVSKPGKLKMGLEQSVNL